MCYRVKFKGDLEALLRGIPEAAQIKDYLSAGGAFLIEPDQIPVKDKVEIFFYLFDAVHFFNVTGSEIEIFD